METIRISEITRGHIRVDVGHRALTIPGEGHLEAPGSPGYVIYADGIGGWEPPHDGEPLSSDRKKEILAAVLRELDARGTRYTVEGAP